MFVHHLFSFNRMLKYYNPKPKDAPPVAPPIQPPLPQEHEESIPPPITQTRELTDDEICEKWAYLEMDPYKRKQILEFHPNVQDEVRRAYLLNGPNQLRLKKYPPRKIFGEN